MSKEQMCYKPLQDISYQKKYLCVAHTDMPILSSHERRSPAIVLENGKPLPGPSGVVIDEIRFLGRGRYTFFNDWVYFSSSDNTNPQENGRIYEISYPEIISHETETKASNPENIIQTEYNCVDWLLGVFGRVGIVPGKNTSILDFGCGSGRCVDQFRTRGYSVVGCDIVILDDPPPKYQGYLKQGIIRKISEEPYSIPFEDNSFDLIFSETVFEHVMDYDTTMAEISRILKPGGISINSFPGRWVIREGHTYVPFSSVIRSYWWLYLWALLGIRNEFQQDLSAKETARINQKYLKEKTIYLTRKKILEYARPHFRNAWFAEEAYYYPKLVMRFPQLLPLHRIWVSETNMRILMLKK